MSSSLPSRPPLILGSSSRFRRELLQRLGIDFEVLPPDLDETPLSGETAGALVDRLAQCKASAVANMRPDAVVIGSDQVAVLGNNIFGKPGTRERAIEQLSMASGQTLQFLTAVCVIAPGGQVAGKETVPTEVKFRKLSRAEIERYLDLEPALNSAGSFQAEGLGITLCEYIRSDDPTALIGLPLVVVRRMLADAGIIVP
jgi:septum formation protein